LEAIGTEQLLDGALEVLHVGAEEGRADEPGAAAEVIIQLEVHAARVLGLEIGITDGDGRIRRVGFVDATDAGDQIGDIGARDAFVEGSAEVKIRGDVVGGVEVAQPGAVAIAAGPLAGTVAGDDVGRAGCVDRASGAAGDAAFRFPVAKIDGTDAELTAEFIAHTGASWSFLPILMSGSR